MIKIVTIDELQPGMIISAPIKNNYGQILIGEGAEITQKHIFLLKTWNISTIQIKSDKNDENESISYDDDQLQEQRNIFIETLCWKPRNKNEEDLVDLGLMAFLNNYEY